MNVDDLLQDEAMSLQEAMTLALALAERGEHVFPVALSWDPTKYDGVGGVTKRPLNDHGHNDATTDPREVRRQFNKAPGRLHDGEELGVGWWPGGSGKMVIDVDDKGGVSGSDVLAALEAENGALPDTVRVTTPSGGDHIVVGTAGRRIGGADLADGINIRAHDGWAVAAGTRTPWGEWAADGGIGILEGGRVADAPTWVLDRLTPGTVLNGSGPKEHYEKVDESKLHSADRAALHALRRLGGHDEYIPGGKEHVAITRPGKRAGVSATIGHIGPGTVRIFSDKWPKLKARAYDADQLDRIADGGELEDDADAPSTDDDHQDELDDVASFNPIDLIPAWRKEKKRPPAEVFKRDDGVALLPPALNYLFGDSGDGKSFVALIAALEEIRAGHPPIWLTYEDANEDLIIDRLRLLGATEDEVAMLSFITPQATLSVGTQRIADLAAVRKARLVVLDSVGEAMAVGGVNEDKDNEVGPWFRQTLRKLHDLNPALAILPIDHSTKSKDNPLFPSGSKRKRSAPTGRAYLLNVRAPFAVGAVGFVQLVVAKDRGGLFKRGDIAAEIMLDATVTPYDWAVRAPREGDSYAPKVRRRNATERVLEVLGEAGVPMTAEQCARIVNGPANTQPGEGRVSISTVQNVLTTLSKASGVARTEGVRADGRRPLALWFLVDRFPQVIPTRDPDRDEGTA